MFGDRNQMKSLVLCKYCKKVHPAKFECQDLLDDKKEKKEKRAAARKAKEKIKVSKKEVEEKETTGEKDDLNDLRTVQVQEEKSKTEDKKEE